MIKKSSNRSTAKRNILVAKQLVRLAKSLVAGRDSASYPPATLNMYSHTLIGCPGAQMIFYNMHHPAMDKVFNYTEDSLRNSWIYKQGDIDDEDIELAMDPDGDEFNSNFGNFTCVGDFELAGCTLKPGFSHTTVKNSRGDEFDVVFKNGDAPDANFFRRLVQENNEDMFD